jgi:hypothetical protein
MTLWISHWTNHKSFCTVFHYTFTTIKNTLTLQVQNVNNLNLYRNGQVSLHVISVGNLSVLHSQEVLTVATTKITFTWM